MVVYQGAGLPRSGGRRRRPEALHASDGGRLGGPLAYIGPPLCELLLRAAQGGVHGALHQPWPLLQRCSAFQRENGGNCTQPLQESWDSLPMHQAFGKRTQHAWAK